MDASQISAAQALVDSHLRRHDDDVAAAFDELVRQHPQLQIWRDMEDVDTDCGLDATVVANDQSPPTDSSQQPTNRFRIVRFHDEGGLGQVFEAVDEELHRKVAVKEIQQRFVDDPGNRHRFEREAQITGGLEHPGIVPVYGMGRHQDGRPYYAMRFIRGRSLRDVIAEFHATDWSSHLAGERTVQLRRLLSKFLDVCQAVHYAHRRGIIHRDIKPANVMIGKYGETLVVDWGLARRVDVVDGTSYDMPDEGTLNLVEEEGSVHTMAGRAVGSPLYMSPEQARGQHELVGPPSDIYSLGAMLFSILTNQPPAKAATRQLVIDKVLRGEIRRARDLNKQVAKSLDAICAKALAFAAEDRYATVADLADDLERYLADEPVSAYRESLSESAWRYVRNHRSRVVTVAATMMVGAIATVAWLWVQRANENKRTAEARRQTMGSFVHGLVTEVPDRAGDQSYFVDYLANVNKALGEQYLSASDRDYDAVVHAALVSFVSGAYLKVGLYAEAAQFLSPHLAILRERSEPTLETTALMDHLAHAYDRSGQSAKAIQLLREEIEIRRRLNADPQYTLKAMQHLGMVYGSLDDDRNAIPLWRNFLQQRIDAGASPALIATAKSRLANALRKACQYQESIFLYEDVVGQRLEQYGPNDRRSISAKNAMATAYRDAGHLSEALRQHRALHATAKQHLGDREKNTIKVLRARVETELIAATPSESLQLAQQLSEVRESLFTDPAHGDRIEAARLLSQAELRVGQPETALKRLAANKQIATHRHQFLVRRDLAFALMQLERYSEALVECNAALESVTQYYAAGGANWLELKMWRAAIQSALGEHRRADEDILDAIQCADEFPGGLRVLDGVALRLARVRLLLVADEIDEAVAQSEEVRGRIARLPERQHFELWLQALDGQRAYLRGDTQQAVAQWEAVVEALPGTIAGIPLRVRQTTVPWIERLVTHFESAGDTAAAASWRARLPQ